jgi:hypothetical protein
MQQSLPYPFVGHRGEFRDRAYQDQVHRASCLHLLVAAIAAWTTPYLADAVDAVRTAGEDVPDELIAHLSPVAWGAGELSGSVHLSIQPMLGPLTIAVL